MVKVRINLTAEGFVTGYEIRGHSGTAKRGQDIVCAGVSSLAQAALMGLLKQLNVSVEYVVRNGDMRVCLKDAPNELTEAILQTMTLGLAEIEKLYPKAVKIEKIDEAAQSREKVGEINVHV